MCIYIYICIRLVWLQPVGSREGPSTEKLRGGLVELAVGKGQDGAARRTAHGGVGIPWGHKRTSHIIYIYMYIHIKI